MSEIASNIYIVAISDHAQKPLGTFAKVICSSGFNGGF